jgi:small subunit ribosomal protein S8
MPLSDPIADFLTRMRNAQHGRRHECRVQWSKIKQALAELLKKHDFLKEASVEGEGIEREVVVTFRTDRAPLTLDRVSTPGARRYAGADDIRAILHGNSIAVISTSAGLLTDKDARKRKIGGEVLCTVS